MQVVPQASQNIIDAAKRESHQWLNPETWRTMQLVAQTFVQSGAMPKSMDTVPKVIVALQAGKEAGMQPIEAINSFYFVNGKVSIYGDMAIAQVLKAGHKIEWGKCDAETATVKIIRNDNGSSNEVTFTMAMAKERGLTSNPVYKKYPENMLRFKAFHACAKFIVSDALHGVPIKEVEEAEYVEEIKTEQITAGKIVVPKPNAVPGVPVPPQETSLEEALEAPEKASEKQVREIVDMAIDKGKDVLSIAKYYNAPDIESLTADQAKEAIALLKKSPKIKIEEMPKEENKSHLPPEKPGEGKAAKAMRAAAGKGKKEREETKGAWPEDVCRYLRFIDGIPDEDLPDDMIELKKDAIKGEFKGYDYYPNLRSQIESLPKDFK